MKKLGEIIDKVKELKDNLFFNLIYENMNLRRSEGERFDNAIVILDNIGKELKYKGIIEIYSFLNFFKKIILFGIKNLINKNLKIYLEKMKKNIYNKIILII
jgi:hypothetical protein